MKTPSLVGKSELRNHSLTSKRYIPWRPIGEPPTSQTKTSSSAKSKASFETHCALGMGRWLAAHGGNALQHLWMLRVELSARPHTNVTSEHFRSTYARGFTQGNSIGGLQCLQPCTHVFGANAGEKQVWEHVTSGVSAQTPSAHEKLCKAALQARPNSLRHLGFTPRPASESPTRVLTIVVSSFRKHPMTHHRRNRS